MCPKHDNMAGGGTDVICDQNISAGRKGKLFKVLVRPAMSNVKLWRICGGSCPATPPAFFPNNCLV